jgi:putative oxidoreductase
MNVWSTIRARLERFPLSVIQLAMRVGVGAIFFNAGLLKYRSWEFTVQLFRDEYKVPLLAPEVAARMAMVQELTIPLLLFAGLATRAATIPLLGMLAVIQLFVYPNAWAEHLVWGSILLFLLTRGPGVLSLDYLVGSVTTCSRRPGAASRESSAGTSA